MPKSATKPSTPRLSDLASYVVAPKGAPVIPFPGTRPSRAGGGLPQRPAEAPRPVRAPTVTPPQGTGSQDLSDMEIPTFIRRQMD